MKKILKKIWLKLLFLMYQVCNTYLGYVANNIIFDRTNDIIFEVKVN